MDFPIRGGCLGNDRPAATKRTVLPLLAGEVIHLDLHTALLTYTLAFMGDDSEPCHDHDCPPARDTILSERRTSAI